MQSNSGKLIALIGAALVLGGAPAGGQAQDEPMIIQEIVIEPEQPDSNDLVALSISNTACEVGAGSQDLENRRFEFVVNVSFFEHKEQCLEADPDAPDVGMTVGPLEPGEYTVVLRLRPGGFSAITVTKRFSVVEAPPAASLSAGGINGLYYNPNADGHYVYVLETDFTTLVVWNTFDLDGNPAWVYGVGELQDGKVVAADTYLNRVGAFFPNGELEGPEVDHWGTLEVELVSCRKGTVRYQSELPEFGSGEFPIERLAFAQAIGCDEVE